MVGSGVTTRLTVLVDVQLNALAPVNVYVVVTDGDTETVVPMSAPGFQVYESAPDPVSVALLPAQILVGLAVAVSVGTGFTINARVPVLEHAPLEAFIV
jgi:hypothetical protein